MDDFPCTKKFNRITASYSVLNHIRRPAVLIDALNFSNKSSYNSQDYILSNDLFVK